MPLRRILRLTPWPARRRLLAHLRRRVLPHVPPHRRLRTARLLVPIAASPRAAEAATTTRVRTAHGRVTARRTPTASPTDVRRENLDRVVTALDAAGVDWFRVPVASITGTAVAVPEADRDRVVALLGALSAGDAGRLEVVRPGGRGRDAAPVLRICWPVTDPGGNLVLGPEYGCEVEFWSRRDGGVLIGPRSNPVADIVAADEPAVFAPEPVFGPFHATGDRTMYRTRAVFTMVSPDRVAFPVDAVYTWVDGGRGAVRAVDSPRVSGTCRPAGGPDARRQRLEK